MDEIILDGSIESQRLLINEMKKFNLDVFFHNKGLSSGAIVLITKNQMIITDTFIRDEKDPNYGSHYDSANEIYKVIFNKEVKNDHNKEKNVNWQETIINDGNILIQLCSDASSLVWTPETIDDNQLHFLEELNKQIKIIIDNDNDYFNDRPIIFDYIENAKIEYTLFNSLDYIIEIKRKSNKIRR